ncbi:hypothetical protein CFP65_1385 [Kitasatospora sp. MMS16-BH015]|uniref:hypothetical protein n=1 Tax=Kitasatospora sp. MMS16-BH015 TaxID=2018025 RepID=UPI000CA23EF1|nr:hypothetical protein [Kitasatospora sp. MMS16-BH015]AUG76284.1 hypothetical protein CFP65_1385 [Kitasatospora sp. MMS16-BH015]
MATAPLFPTPTGVFAVIHRQVTGALQPRPTHLVLPGTDPAEQLRLSPADVWQRLYGADRDTALNDLIWQRVVRLAQREIKGTNSADSVTVSGWSQVLLWLAMPRLRSTVRRLGWEFGLERAELESAAVLGLLEGLDDLDPDQPKADGRLVRSALRQCWALVEPAHRERAVEDIGRLAGAQDPCPDPAEELAWELSITPPARPEGLAAQLRFTASPESVEGFRLGALAERFGLREVVHRARRPKPGDRIGTLSLRPAQAHR